MQVKSKVKTCVGDRYHIHWPSSVLIHVILKDLSVLLGFLKWHLCNLTQTPQLRLLNCLTLAVSVSWPSLSVAGLTHPDGDTAPASLWHRHPVAGAGMAETLATWSAVMLPLRLHEHLLTAVTGLTGGEKKERHFFSCGSVYYNFNPYHLNCSVSFWCLGFSSSYSQWSLCWVSSMAVPPGQWARRRQLWWGPCCTPTLTGSRSSSHPGPSGQRSGGWSERCPTKRRKSDEKMETVEGEVQRVLLRGTRDRWRQ